MALHCGDTASLPGLNLPITSIRLALWVDALRELGIEGTMATNQYRQAANSNQSGLIAAFWLVFLVTIGTVTFFKATPSLANRGNEVAKIKPLTVALNKPIDQFEYYQTAIFNISPQSKCFVYLYGENGPNNYLRIFPNLKKSTEEVDPALYSLSPGQTRTIDMVGDSQIRVDCSPLKLHLITLNNDQSPLSIGPSYEQSVVNGATIVNFIDTTREINQARELQKKHPEQVQEFVFDGPVATKASKLKYEQAQPAK